MAKVIDLTGMVFGKLTVIGQATERGNKKQIKWNCRCECESYHTVTGESLRGGKSKSCGCFKYEPTNKIKDRKIAILRYQYAQIQKRHRKKPKSTIISVEEYISIVCSPCYYCECESSIELEDRRCWTKSKGLISDTKVKINGIDRINSDIGYTSENSVPCCKYCNTAKNVFTREEFKQWIVRAYNYYASNPNKL
jgi:hypothetical protein